MNFQVIPIGRIASNAGAVFIKVEARYTHALQALDGFSHLNVIWWFNDFDDENLRGRLTVRQPYKGGPDTMGIFATRSPVRPNPIALTTVRVIQINQPEGTVQVSYIDANEGTPVLDIKPYTPSLDRVEHPDVPDWCSHWPISLERSASFNWEKEFS